MTTTKAGKTRSGRRLLTRLGEQIGFASVGTSLLLAAVLAILAPTAAEALTANRVDAKRDWSIFEAEADGNKVCWIVSQPKQSSAFREGKPVEVRRGDIFLMVAVRPADGVVNEVSFIAGYPFQQGTTVETKIGSNEFTMFTDGENAWLSSPDEDNQIVGAFRRGRDAEVRGTSSRGTTTVDTFSLLGFTAALQAAKDLCGQ
ncbi:MAG: invasion associated locus B family protein [Pseudomonadota bacterium]